MATANSYAGRVAAEWGNVQAEQGNGYVPDPDGKMDAVTLQINYNKIQKWIDYYSVQPVPENVADLYAKEVAGGGQSISSVIKDILEYLRKKQAKYAVLLNNLAPGAGSLDTASQQIVDPVTGEATTTNPPPALPGKSNSKWWIIGGCAALVLVVVTIVVIKKRQNA